MSSKSTDAAPESRQPQWNLVLGLALFGSLVGVTTGLSETSGISQVLLSSLFTFTGGVLLTYTGFRRKGQDARLDTQRIGNGLSAFSLGVLVGLYAGIYARLDPPVPASVQEAGAVFSLHSDAKQVCSAIRSNRVDGIYGQSEGAEATRRDLEELYQQVCVRD